MFLGPSQRDFLTVDMMYIEPMCMSGHTRVMIFMGVALTTYDVTPGYRSARHNQLRGLAVPAFLDRSL